MHRVRGLAARALARLGDRSSEEDLIYALLDADPAARSGAAFVLGRLGVREALPSLRTLLEDPVRDVRREAAASLCLLGSPDGAEVLLGGGIRQPLFMLNALRHPDLWNRLSREGRGLCTDDPLPEALRRIERETGLAAERATPAGREPSGIAPCRFPHNASLESFASRRPFPAAAGWDRQDLILETDRIRVLSWEDAFTFWKAWWESRRERGRPPMD